jgi:hypothetical protein
MNETVDTTLAISPDYRKFIEDLKALRATECRDPAAHG